MLHLDPAQSMQFTFPCLSKYRDLLIGEQIDDDSMQKLSLMLQQWRKEEQEREEKEEKGRNKFAPDPLDRL